MSTVADIESAITRLSAPEFVELERWFEEQRERRWDEQIEKDSASGAMDRVLREVENDIAQGKTGPDDVLLDH